VRSCLSSAVVGGLVAICDRPDGHQPANIHYDVELNRAWKSADFEGPVRAVLGEAERREAEEAYWQSRRRADEADLGTGMAG
jgi:hypothetical protein